MSVARAPHTNDARVRRVRVVVADTQPLFHAAATDAIRRDPRLELVAEASDGRQALEVIAAERPDVAVLERDLPGLSGEQVVNALSRDGFPTRVILIAAEPKPAAVYRTIVSGAAGYLTTDADARELCEAIDAVSRGKTVFGAQLHAGIASEMRLRDGDGRPRLSDRELQVLKLIAAGLSTSAIGQELHLTKSTVKTYQEHLYGKLGVSGRAAAVAEAMRQGLVE